jgi:lipopolysaccharide transport system ATP-binding protein
MSLLKVSNLGKSFSTYASEWQRVARWIGAAVKPVEETWVLKNVNFEIHPGEAIGVIGQNGAGKSTLLKMVTGTLKPTTGTITLNGRISAILELGMGFNPELTGRQNVYHTAGLLGMSFEEIQQALPEIEAFAEIGEYFDQPVRTYSSGMQVRVAFAVATAYRPEILIVDEALSVGDAYFQHKSFDRIREFQRLGTTLLFVSHDRHAIQTLCNRAILLEKGVVVKDGDPEAVFDFYNALIADKENQNIQTIQLEDGKTQTISGTGEAKIIEIGLYNQNGDPVEFVNVGEPLELRAKVNIHKDVESLVFGYGVRDRLGQVMYGTNTWHTKQVIHSAKAGEQYQFVIAFPAHFGVGSYSIQTALVDKDTHLTANYEWRDLALIFQVVNMDKVFFDGYLWNEPRIYIKKQEVHEEAA